MKEDQYSKDRRRHIATKLSVEDQALLRKVSTTYTPTEDRPIWHGETGTTYGGSGYSSLFRTVFFPSHGARKSAGNGCHLRDGRGE